LLEYNYLVNECGMDESEAWEKSEAIVIHGDELARRHLAEE
jgi:hypothetical protein